MAISLDIGYVKTLSGIFRLVCTVLDFLNCFIAGIYCYNGNCVSVRGDAGGISWALFVFSTGFLVIGALFLMRVLNVFSQMGPSFPLIEMVIVLVYAVLHVTGFITMAYYASYWSGTYWSSWVGQSVVACLFSLAIAALLGAEAFFLYRNRNNPAAGPGNALPK